MSSPITILFDGPAGPVWRHFAALSAVPRPSRQEEAIRQHLLAIGAANGWDCRRDAFGNLVFGVAGRGRLASAPILGLQGHMDMVCEKNSDVQHDFTRDPIRLQVAGNWVTADGTTLGADNGVAIALAFAVAEADLPDRPPLELIITSDEETGLNGAAALDPAIVQARRIINLDAEEDGVFIIGCAGGADITVEFDFTGERGCDGEVWSLHVRGLRGGHSGVNIHEGRSNAIRATAGILLELAAKHPSLRLHGLDGGNKRNAIPRECRCTFSGCPPAALDAAAEAMLAHLRASGEPSAEISWTSSGHPECVRVLPLSVAALIAGVPHGVIAMDPHFPDLVQTSNSIGVVETAAAGVTVHMHTRSSSEEARRHTVATIGELAGQRGGRFTHLADYPGWEPNPNSALPKQGVAQYEACFGESPRVEGIHAGLECGIIGARLGISELLAYGPTIENAHSPDERLSIQSLERTWQWLQAIVTQTL